MPKTAKNKILNVPNAISVFRIVFLIPLIGHYFWNGENITAVLLCAVFMILDVLDGYLARKLKQMTNFGVFLDATGDNLFAAVVVFVFAFSGYVSWPLVAFIAAHRFTRLFLSAFIGMYGHGYYMPEYIKILTASLPAIYFFTIPFLINNFHIPITQINLITMAVIGGAYIILVISVIVALIRLKKGTLKMVEVEKLEMKNLVDKEKVAEVRQKVKQNVKEETSIANTITIVRTLAVIAGLILLKGQPIFLAILIILAIALDAADGYIARKYRGSKRGALIDILGDRVVELVILFTYSYWGLISYVFPIIFLVRGLATDFLRLLNAMYPEEKFSHPLQMGNAINKFMRGFYAILKAVAFTTILFWPKLGFWMMVFAVVVNLYRGIPAIFNQRSKQLLKIFFKRITTPVSKR